MDRYSLGEARQSATTVIDKAAALESIQALYNEALDASTRRDFGMLRDRLERMRQQARLLDDGELIGHVNNSIDVLCSCVRIVLGVVNRDLHAIMDRIITLKREADGQG